METIREISSFSHDGINQMWYPFSAKLKPYSTIIGAAYYYEIGELIGLIRSMFATNNHHPEILSKPNVRMTKRYLTGSSPPKTVCSITFKTDQNEYKLQRCFYEQYSVEAKLHKIGTDIVYHGQNAIQVLTKFHKPLIVSDEHLFRSNSSIFKPINDYSRKTLVALANNWLRMVGIGDSSFDIDYEGRWSLRGDFSHFYVGRHHRAKMPSVHNLFSKLAQAVMKKRTYSMCVPICCPFDIETLNNFEAIAVIDLIKHVCKEEGIQFIVAMNSNNKINSMIDAGEAPNLSIYET